MFNIEYTINKEGFSRLLGSIRSSIDRHNKNNKHYYVNKVNFILYFIFLVIQLYPINDTFSTLH